MIFNFVSSFFDNGLQESEPFGVYRQDLSTTDGEPPRMHNLLTRHIDLPKMENVYVSRVKIELLHIR
jgi:hypothetical protein